MYRKNGYPLKTNISDSLLHHYTILETFFPVIDNRHLKTKIKILE